MYMQPTMALDIAVAAPTLPSTAPEANSGLQRSSAHQPAWSAITRWFADVALYGAADGPAAFYGEIWRDPTTFFPPLSSR